ncbi:MAG: methyltransferase domain-containing protein [Pseudomonadota bacterium]
MTRLASALPWLLTCVGVGTWLALAGLWPSAAPRPMPDAETGRNLLLPGGLALVSFTVLFALLEHALGRRRLDSPRTPEKPHSAGWTLLLVSGSALFLEVMLIRYTGSQIRVFAYFKNIPLLAAYLGLGIGCWQGGERAPQLIAFFRWLLPVTALLSLGPIAFGQDIGRWAALGSSEHVLGLAGEHQPSSFEVLSSQALMAGVCVVALVVLTLLFVRIGRLLGPAFDGMPRIAAYSINVVGSLLGILLFVGLGYLETPPWLWFAIGLAPLLLLGEGWRSRARNAVLVAACCALVWPSPGETVWSPYQKLIGHQVPAGPGGTGNRSPGFLVEISDVFYQVAVDLRPGATIAGQPELFPHYRQAFAEVAPGGRILIVGAGTGNDVAAALRAGAARVDAVDIDPAIVRMGQQYHPEQPYADARVHVIVDDARAVFQKAPAGTYDAVVFGLLDSHTQLGFSSVRLDNYVFTVDSLAAVRRLLRPGGHIVLTAATHQQWFRERFVAMMQTACDGPVAAVDGAWSSFSCQVSSPQQTPVARPAGSSVLPSDDWPFLYLPRREIPLVYALTIAVQALASALLLRGHGIRWQAMTAAHGHLFFLGAAFLLLEVSSINRLALLFGTTWMVSAFTIAIVLALIVAANLAVQRLPRSLPHAVGYTGLLVSLTLSFALPPSLALGSAWPLQLAYAGVLLSPVFFAGLVFAHSFSSSAAAGPALGANMLGAVVGCWAEYLTMAVGIRALVLLAAVFYLASLLMAWRARHGVSAGFATPPADPG